MAYIDLVYYKTTFSGRIDGLTDDEITRFISRASDNIDLITDFAISDFNLLTEYQKNCVKKSTAYFTEFFVENGDVFNEAEGGSESIGSWSSSGGSGKPQICSEAGMVWIKKSGLINSNVRVGGHLYAEEY